MKTLNQLRDEIHANAKEKGFWDNKREIGTLLMLIVSELSEALEADRKSRRCLVNSKGLKYMLKHSEASDYNLLFKGTFEEEMADVIIRVLDLCGGMGIDIEKHVELKMQYNKFREKMHGKKY